MLCYDGERGRNRTYNLLIKSQLLCQLSYAPAEEIVKRGAACAAPKPDYHITPGFHRSECAELRVLETRAIFLISFRKAVV